MDNEQSERPIGGDFVEGEVVEAAIQRFGWMRNPAESTEPDTGFSVNRWSRVADGRVLSRDLPAIPNELLIGIALDIATILGIEWRAFVLAIDAVLQVRAAPPSDGFHGEGEE